MENSEITNGILYLCSTPVGNLEDITLRALRILKEVDFIACEDTRHTIKLLNHFGIKKKLISYHEHNEFIRASELVQELIAGKSIAIVTDAGTPAISDPGATIVKLAIENFVQVVPLPGASAFLLTLISSGFDCTSFIYEGFLGREKNKRHKKIISFKDEPRTIVFYESPYRIIETLEELKSFLGNRNICIGKEITKKFEFFWRGNIEEGINYFSANIPKGEFCIVIEGNKGNINEPDELKMEKRIDELKNQGCSKKEISKTIASEFNMSAKIIYNQLVQEN